MLLENQVKVSHAITLLQAEIDSRMGVIGALRAALDALVFESTGAASEEMSKDEVATLLGVSITSVNRYMAGRVPGGKSIFPQPISSVGRTHRWRRTDIVHWKASFLFPQ